MATPGPLITHPHVPRCHLHHSCSPVLLLLLLLQLLSLLMIESRAWCLWAAHKQEKFHSFQPALPQVLHPLDMVLADPQLQRDEQDGLPPPGWTPTSRMDSHPRWLTGCLPSFLAMGEPHPHCLRGSLAMWSDQNKNEIFQCCVLSHSLDYLILSVVTILLIWVKCH